METVKAFKFIQYSYDKPNYTFLDDRSTPVCYVKELDGGKYRLVMFDKAKFNSYNRLEKDIVLMRLQRVNGTFDKNYFDIVKSDSVVNLKKITEVMLKDVKMRIGEFKERYFKTDVDTESVVKVGNWRIVCNDGGKIDNATALVTQVNSLLGAKFGKLCYGDVLVMKALSGRTLADYSAVHDDIRIKNQRNNAEMLHSFIHELGHRFYSKFATKNQKDEISEVYYDIRSNEPKVTFSKGMVVRFSFADVTMKIEEELENKKVYCLCVQTNDARFTVGKHYSVSYALPLSDIREINGKPVQKQPSEFVFPTDYSRTSVNEFFCECFSLFIQKKLNRTMMSWMSELL